MKEQLRIVRGAQGDSLTDAGGDQAEVSNHQDLLPAALTPLEGTPKREDSQAKGEASNDLQGGGEGQHDHHHGGHKHQEAIQEGIVRKHSEKERIMNNRRKKIVRKKEAASPTSRSSTYQSSSSQQGPEVRRWTSPSSWTSSQPVSRTVGRGEGGPGAGLGDLKSAAANGTLCARTVKNCRATNVQHILGESFYKTTNTVVVGRADQSEARKANLTNEMHDRQGNRGVIGQEHPATNLQSKQHPQNSSQS